MIRKLHYLLSDIHLEYQKSVASFSDLVHKYPLLINGHDTNLFKTGTLILAGDIGYPTEKKYWNFLKSCSDEFKNVIYTTGNHEYWKFGKTSIFDIDKQMQNMANKNKMHNLHYLNMHEININQIRYLGATLWSNRKVSLKSMHSTSHDIRNSHKVHVDWLQNKLNIDKTTHTLVITHHMPSLKLIAPKYKNCENSGFATDLEHLIQPNLKMWVCGHTHTGVDIMINGCRFLINPLGRPDEINKTIRLVSFYL